MNRKAKILLLGLYSVLGFAQIKDSNKLPVYTPSSPKTYEFIKYGETPVSKYTGVPDTSIPLFNLDVKAISLSLSLSYHSNGVKVNEEASCVGIGWSLNTNWSVVQQINGFDDYDSSRREYNRLDMENHLDCISDNIGNPEALSGINMLNNCERITFYMAEGSPIAWEGAFTDPDANYCTNTNVLTSTGQSVNNPGLYQVFFNNFMKGLKDYEPDIFNFNIPGYSGKFIFDYFTNTYTCVTDSNIKITADNGGVNNPPSNFRITTPDGNLFLLSLKETTTVVANGYTKANGVVGPSESTINIVGSVSSRVFQLTSIETNKSESIQLQYLTTAEIVNFPNISKSDVRYKEDFSYGGNGPFPSELSDIFTSYSITKQPYSYLEKITINNNECIVFNYSDRIDLVGAKKLDNIELRTNVNGTVIKKYNFTYDYFVGHTNGTNNDVYLTQFQTYISKSANELTHRLKLLSVSEQNSKPYLFEYDNEILPKKTSLSLDYWGNYNGILTNNSMFVDIYKFNKERDNLSFYDHRNNINCSILQFAKAALLNKITYPTGGYTRFNYELNSFDNFKAPPLDQGISKTINLSTIANPNPNIEQILMIEGGSAIFNINGLLSVEGCSPNYPDAVQNCYFKMIHFKKALVDYIRNNPTYNAHLNSYGLKYVLAVDLDFLDGNPSNPALYNQYKDSEITIQKTFNPGTGWNYNDEFISNRKEVMPEGIVFFKVSGGCGVYSPTLNNNWSQSSFNISYNEYKPLNQLQSYGAGLRIKNIINYNFDHQVISNKRYSYYGGKLMSDFKFFNSKRISSYAYESPYANAAGIEISGDKKTLNSNSFIPLSTNALGKYVGYDFVDEHFETFIPSGQNQNIGKIRDYYTNFVDASIGLDHFGKYTELNLPLFQINPDNGLSTKKQIFDKNDNLLKEYINNYSFQSTSCFHGMKQIFDKIVKFTNGQYFGQYKVNFVGIYPILISKTTLSSSNEISYFNGNEISNLKNYLYDNKFQISKITETNSLGENIENIISYPYTEGLPEFSGMVARNMLTPIVEKIIKINGVSNSLEQQKYKWVATPNTWSYFQSTYALDKIRFAKSGIASDLEDNNLIHNYDENANPTEVSKKDGTRVSYIWGYKGKYLVAKIENASQPTFDNATLGLTVIPSTLINDIKNASNTGTETNLITALNNLRNASALSNTMITTFTYKPLIGVSTITDSKGDTQTFTYDNLGRLQYVKDKDGKILSENEYHYRP